MQERVEELHRQLARSRRRSDKVAIYRELSGMTIFTDPEQSLEYARESFQLAGKIDNELELGRSSGQLGQVLHYLRRYDEAEPYLENAIAIYERHEGTASRRSGLLRQLATIKRSRGDLASTVPLLQLSLELARQEEKNNEICDSLVWLSHTAGELGDYVWAMSMLEEAVELAKEAADPQSLAMAYNGLSAIQQRMGNHQEALNVLYEVLEIARSTGNKVAEAVVLGNVATANRMIRQEEKALQYGAQAIAMYEEMGWQQNVVISLYDVSACHCQLLQWEEGFAAADRAIELARHIDARAELVMCQALQGNNLMEFGDLDRALPMLLEAEQVANELGLVEQSVNVHSLLSELYEKRGEFELALRHMKRYMEYKNEQDLLNVRQRLSAMELRMNVERAEKEKEIFRLKAEQLHRDMEQKNRELAAMALQQVQTGEIVARLQKMIRSMAPETGGSGRDMAKVLMEHIGQLGATDSQWKSFEERFTPVHPEFVRKLATMCADLTPTEMKICTLLRINMSSKEIAAFLGTSVRTVEGHRRFIRRRLNLPPDGSLTMFLATL